MAAEGCGTAILLVAVVGSGITAERLWGGNVALALLANAVATGGALTAFANPAVTPVRAATDTSAGIRPADVPGFLVERACGAFAATALFRWLAPGRGAAVAPELLTPHASPETSP
jgi:glycerol uptake facilitator-like aquaporin